MTDTEKPQGKLRLPYLDGLRGISALYVVVFHALQSGTTHNNMWVAPFLLGHYAVTVFIVLSGYSLMLSVIHGRDVRTIAEWKDYIKRRAWRILPPYYAVLVLGLLLFVATRIMQHRDFIFDFGTNQGSPLAFDNLLAHLLVVHNLKPAWTVITPNPPLWSVATEWQIYWLLPLILLPFWRISKWWVGLLLAMLITVPLYYVLPEYRPVSPWFAAIFALGVGAAVLSEDSERNQRFLKITGLSCFVTLFIAFCLCAHSFGADVTRGIILTRDYWYTDFIVGGGIAGLLIYLRAGNRLRINNGQVVRSDGLLSHPLSVLLGKFSYSLYLTHFTVLHLVVTAFPGMDALRGAGYWLAKMLCILAALVIGYLFYLLVERRTMHGVKRVAT